MSQSLYRTYRPHTFAEVIGQEQVVKALEQSVKNGSISHAYLFSGGRGTGKTSMARIFARALNIDPSDMYEIDAASNRGIDDVRELRDSVHTLPFLSKYKMYIIDEVHMLTKEAFNALLKTLEEPPAHALFVLATTELEKVPDTIISRCQNFIFKKPNQATLAHMVTAVAKKEGYAIDAPAATMIALIGDGSFRDTHGVLEKVISAIDGGSAAGKGASDDKSGDTKNKKITLEIVEESTGVPPQHLVYDFVQALVLEKKDEALRVLGKAQQTDIDARLFTELTLRTLRTALLYKINPSTKASVVSEYGEDAFARIETIAAAAGLTSKLLLRILGAYTDVTRSPLPFLPLELAVVDAVV